MSFFWFLLLLSLRFDSIHAQQFYDPFDCSKNSTFPGSRYACNSSSSTCDTYIVYRANMEFNTVLKISQLLKLDPSDLLPLNNVESETKLLESGREILVPVICTCVDRFFQVNLNYTVHANTTVSEIACSVFEGLVKSNTLIEENKIFGGDFVGFGYDLQVSLKCACPDRNSSRAGVRFLVVYPVMEGDLPQILTKKFSVSVQDFSVANSFRPLATIFTNTTVLIPLRTSPHLNLNIPYSPPPAGRFLPTVPVKKPNDAKVKVYIVGSVIGFTLVIAVLAACVLYVKALCKMKVEKLQSFNTRSSPFSSPRSGLTGRSSATSCLSPDLLVGIKYSLKTYTIDDLKCAMKNFHEESKIGDQTYKGLINNVKVMIKETRFEDTRQVIDVHSKLNHKNIVNLLGVCYGPEDSSPSYLVFELPSNGCLRECLSNPLSPLRWEKRLQIAFDIATALHYLHYCIFPSCAQLTITSSNIFVTSNWRAKLTNIKAKEPGPSPSSEKVDIYAFGVVLLELISGKDHRNSDSKALKEEIGFLGGVSEGGCFEQLRSFMDPWLKEDYPLAEALCLGVLAKACVEDDPLHRPSMDDILKVIVRIA